jgi:hypothetical protein
MMVPLDQIRHDSRSVVVNKPALQAWLQAWTTGESFPSRTDLTLSSNKEKKLDLALLRRLHSKVRAQPKRKEFLS